MDRPNQRDDRRRWWGGLTLALIALVAVSCGRREEVVPEFDPITPPTVPSLNGSENADDPEEAPAIAFQIGDRAYTQDFFDRQYAADVAMRASRGEEPLTPSSYRQLLIDELLLLRAAQRSSLITDPVLLAQVEAQRRQLIGDSFVTDVLFRDVRVSRAEVAAHYQENLDQYIEPEQVRVRRVQFGSLEQAEEAVRRLNRDGLDFAEVADVMGVDVIVSGWLSRGQYEPQVEEAVFSMEVGDISPILSTDVGFLLMEKVGVIPQSVTPLSDVEGEIRALLLTQRRRRLLREYLGTERLLEGIDGPPVLVP